MSRTVYARALRPGRDLDVFLAEKVTNAKVCDPYSWAPDWREHYSTNEWGHKTYYTAVPPYSTDLAAAWQLFTVNEFRFYGISVEWRRGGADYVWRCKLVANALLNPHGGVYVGYGDTQPLCICAAALAAVGVEPGELFERRAKGGAK